MVLYQSHSPLLQLPEFILHPLDQTWGHMTPAELDLEFAASVTDVPYHAGAAKYFAEKGIEVPVK